jgi:hypothetical protein
VRLEFSLLVVDDRPDSVDGAIGDLADYLEAKGFTLRKTIAPDLSENALRDLARSSGKDYNLVMVDYNLERADINGATAAARLRRELQYTDMVFYSSAPSVDLLAELAKHGVAGVFVADRGALGDALKGLADTVIAKAVDLSHMRGIAMAEVSDMDFQMEEILEKVFSAKGDRFAAVAKRTLALLTEGAEEHKNNIGELVKQGKILEIVTDPRLFSSMHKYRAVMRSAGCLNEKPIEALSVLKNYVADVINNRNTLAHAKEDQSSDGTSSLRAISKGKLSIPIDDAWMEDFRGRLRTQRNALSTVCEALGRYVDGLAASQESK